MLSTKPDGVFEYTPEDCPDDGLGTPPAVSNRKIELHYLAEGAANVVYRICSTDGQELPLNLRGQLLRLRKDKPSSPSCSESVQAFCERIVPLFSSTNLIDWKLWPLPKGLIRRLNTSLVESEVSGKRNIKRHGVYIAPQSVEKYGILVQDMSHKRADEYFIEFKPKWLLQSPSAPKNAQRCRNCALKEMREADEVPTGRGDSGFCPLHLLSTEADALQSALCHIWPVDETLDLFEKAFKDKVQPLLFLLRKLQAEYNNVGLTDFEHGRHRHLPIAMALRDCSVFIKLLAASHEVRITDVRLADLDLKTTAGGNLAKWADTERRLIDERWYSRAEDAGCIYHSRCCALSLV